MITLHPVAHFESIHEEKADLPRQGSLGSSLGILRFEPGKGFEQALEDLEGMEKIWVLFWMDRVSHFKSKIQPPRDVKKKGVFATRSPHRPNPIGLSCVTLVSVSGLAVTIKDHDLLDGTPILDIKPYLPYADSFPHAKTGWIEESPPVNKMQWSTLALEQLMFLEKEVPNLKDKVEVRLQHFSSPSSSNRVDHLEKNTYKMAYKTWRFFFRKEDSFITIERIESGYDRETLQGLKTSSWYDVDVHQRYIERFKTH